MFLIFNFCFTLKRKWLTKSQKYRQETERKNEIFLSEFLDVIKSHNKMKKRSGKINKD